MSSGGDKPLPYGSTTDALKSLCDKLNFIGIWLPTFERNYVWICNKYKKMKDFSKQVTLTMTDFKPDNFKKNCNLFWDI